MSAPQSTPPPLRYAELAKLSDEAVMLRLQLGQHDALAVLFDRYHRLVMNLPILRLKPPVKLLPVHC
jgi:hypothetical protein